ncbi:unnamed protein product [Zymoseptoria tritici ST99CH_3D1]|nr:unnamed protein product [Zymoseptoria tritici ST99CH_3D1]
MEQVPDITRLRSLQLTLYQRFCALLWPSDTAERRDGTPEDEISEDEAKRPTQAESEQCGQPGDASVTGNVCAQSDGIDAAATGVEPVRRTNYIRIFPEDLEDYTPGPVRFISATDGYNPVVALLMRHDLAQFIKRTIKLQRMYDQMERQGKLQLEELERYEKGLRREIRIRKMAPSEAGSDGELPTTKKELKTLMSLLEVVPVEKELLQNRLRYKGDLLLEANHDVTKFLDEAFVAALLYEPKVDEEEQIEIFNLEERFQTLHTESYPEEAKFLPAQEPEGMNVCEKPAEPTLVETAKHDAMVKLWEARKSLETAQQEFDEKDDRRAWELHQRRTEEMSGEASFDATEEDFDIRWVACNRELTRNLIDAEEFFNAAEAKASELGCELPQDTEGYYGGEGFIEYYESDHIVDGDFSEDPRVGSWISELPEVAIEDPETLVEVRGEICEWECREVEISDSLSAVDYDCKRSKIDAYEQACRGNRE